MILVTTYKIKPYANKGELKAMLEAFAAHGAGPGSSQNYTSLDGKWGLAIAETDDLEGTYANMAQYTEWLEFDVTVMMPVETVVPLLMNVLG
jgi:hypothetical protein